MLIVALTERRFQFGKPAMKRGPRTNWRRKSSRCVSYFIGLMECLLEFFRIQGGDRIYLPEGAPKPNGL